MGCFLLLPTTMVFVPSLSDVYAHYVGYDDLCRPLHKLKSTYSMFKNNHKVHPIVTKRPWRFQRTVSIQTYRSKSIPITREMGIQPPSGGIDLPRLDKPAVQRVQRVE